MRLQVPKNDRYDAFISYRHIKRDQAIACSLLNLLEALPLKGRKKFHIFRDREEFPTSSDLGNTIHSALENSDYLILICSPEYLESKWCREELTYFRKLHGDTNRNIIPILVSGEPAEAFPKELFTQEEERITPDGTMERYTRHMEPLGADVRGKTIRKSKKMLRDTEYLRIAAAMLNCRFDDLYHREQRRLRKKLALGSAGIAAGASVMISFLLWQLFQVKQAQLHEQLTYAQRSFDSGDRLRSRESTLEILDDYFWPMDASIQDGSRKLEFMTSYTPQFSVVTSICQNVSNHRFFFSQDGSTVLEWDYTRLTRYSLKGEVLSQFSLGAKGQKISAVSPDGTRAAILRLDSNGVQNMDLWDTEGETYLGTLLDCASADTRTQFLAEFSPDGAALSVWCQGGISNSSEHLCLFDGRTGDKRCSLDISLLGTLNDGGTDRIVKDFSFIGTDLARWTGGTYEVFYSLSQKSVQRIPRYWAGQYARTFSGACLALGRYAVVDAGYGIEVLDLAQLSQEQFSELLRKEQLDVKPVRELHGTLAAYVQTVTLQSGREVVSGFWVRDLENPERFIYIENLEGYGWRNPVFYSSKDSSVVYLSVTDSKQRLIRIDLEKPEATLLPYDQSNQQLLFLGSGNGQDFFAGSVGERTVLLSFSEEGLTRQREVELSLTQLEQQHDLAFTPEGVCLIAPYQGSNCLFSMESEARQLDEQSTVSNSMFLVSADGSRWIGCQGSKVTGGWDGSLELKGDVCYAGVGLNGNGFAASTKELLVFQADGRELFRQVQEENGMLFDAIRSAKLSENGAYLYWLTCPSISGSVVKRNTCKLHSLELESGTVTDYPFDVLWLGDYPAENMYDCSPDGKRAVFLSDTTVPQLRLLQVNQTDHATWAEGSAFDELNLPTNEILTGVEFADERRLVCTAGNVTAVVDADTLKSIWGVAEQASSRRLPQLWSDGTLVYFGSSLDFWDTSTGELLGSLSADAEASLTRSRDGKWFVLSDASGTVLYDAETLSPVDLLSSTPLCLHFLGEDHAIYSDGCHLYQIGNP